MRKIMMFLTAVLAFGLLVSCATTENKVVAFEDLDKSGFVPCSKRSYEVEVRRAVEPTHVYNRLEDVHYDVLPEETERIIITGTAGEEWVTKISKVLSTYTNLDGSELTADQIPADGTKLRVKTIPGSDNYALFVPKNVQVIVQTAWGDVLTANRDGVPHLDGDYLMCAGKDGKPNLEDVWVVNGEIFEKTYELR